MAKTLQFRRDSTGNLSSVTGSVGEIFIDTTKKTVVVMDGSTAGGFPLELEGAGTGATGPQGIQGASGISGASGYVGLDGATGVQGASGSTGLTGATGEFGATGYTGATGVKGDQGTFGGEAVDILFSNNTTVSDPTSGYFKFNSGTFSSITKLSISHTDHLSQDISTILHSIDDSTSSVKGYFSVSDELDPDIYAVFSITGALTDHTTWDEVPVQWMSGSTSLTNGGDYIITFQRAGDKGDTGLTGATGVQGASGATGLDGATGAAGSNGVNGATGPSGGVSNLSAFLLVGATGNQGATGPTGNGWFGGALFVGGQGATGVAWGATGEIRATAEITAYYSSDERLKENIIPIDNALGKLRQLKGVMFDWKDDVVAGKGGEDGYFVRKHDTGVIAQEVEEVLPEVVAERADGFKAVRYEKLAGLIIQAINELADQVDALKK